MCHIVILCRNGLNIWKKIRFFIYNKIILGYMKKDSTNIRRSLNEFGGKIKAANTQDCKIKR